MSFITLLVKWFRAWVVEYFYQNTIFSQKIVYFIISKSFRNCINIKKLRNSSLESFSYVGIILLAKGKKKKKKKPEEKDWLKRTPSCSDMSLYLTV